MKNETDINGTDLEEETPPTSGHGKMPLLLLLLWIANVAFFFIYFAIYGLPDLWKWLEK